jgi:MFS family permease
LKTSKIFYGYWVLAACYLLTFLTAGCGPISFSFFITSLEKSLGWSRTEIMTAFTFFFICTAVGAPFAGRMVHHYGARKVVSLGCSIACIGFIILSQTSNLWQFYLGYSLIGLGFASTGQVITTLVVSNWFVRHRGMAVGALSMGPGTAGLLFTPLVIMYLIPNLGWSNTYLIYAVITGGLGIPLAALVLRTTPADMGQLPDGKVSTKITDIDPGVPASEGVSFKQAVTILPFWLVGFAVLFVSTHMGIMQSLIPHLEDLDFSAGIAASAMSIVATTSALGPLAFGWLSDKIKVKPTAIIAVSLLTIGTIILLQIKSGTSPWIIWIFAVILGTGVGGWMPSMSLLTSTNFGLLAYGTIFGVLNAFQCLGSAAAPVFMGYVYDTRGTFNLAFIIIAILVALGIPTILAIQRQKTTPKKVSDKGTASLSQF